MAKISDEFIFNYFDGEMRSYALTAYISREELERDKQLSRDYIIWLTGQNNGIYKCMEQ